MPDDTFEIPDVPNAEQDLMAPTEERYYECAECSLKPGAALLCLDCLERRTEHSSTGRTRRPLYRALSNDEDRRRYLRYLARERDQREVPDDLSIWTEEDLDREFPDRHEERLPGYRWGAFPSNLRVPMPDEVVLRNSWGIPSIWAPLQVSRLLGTADVGLDLETVGPPEPPRDLIEGPDGRLAVISDPPFNLGADLPHLDQQIEAGLQPGRLVMMSGRRSGRSQLAAQWALEAMRGGFDVSVIRPQGQPINLSAEVAQAADESTEDILRNIRETMASLGASHGRDPAIMPRLPLSLGIDEAQEPSRSVLAMWNFSRVGQTPYARLVATQELGHDAVEEMRRRWESGVPREVSHQVAMAVATLLDMDFELENPYDTASEFEDWPLLAVQQVLHNVGISPSDAGLAGIPKLDRQTARRERSAWWVLADEFWKRLKPRPTRAGVATGPTRFERDLTVPDDVVYRNTWPEPRLNPPQAAASTISYLNHPHRERQKAAFDKLFGEALTGAFDIASRYERINWSDE